MASIIATYNGTNIIDEDGPNIIYITYDGSEIQRITGDGTYVLKTKGTVAKSNIVIGNRTLKCNGKYFLDDITINCSYSMNLIHFTLADDGVDASKIESLTFFGE